MNFTFNNISVLKYTNEGFEILQTTNEGKELTIENGKIYKVKIKIDSEVQYDSVGFDLLWDVNSIEPIIVNENVDFVDDGLYAGQDYDLVVNQFLEEKRLYITKALKPGEVFDSVGIKSVVTIRFQVIQVGTKLHLYIEIEEEI